MYVKPVLYECYLHFHLSYVLKYIRCDGLKLKPYFKMCVTTG